MLTAPSYVTAELLRPVRGNGGRLSALEMPLQSKTVISHELSVQQDSARLQSKGGSFEMFECRVDERQV